MLLNGCQEGKATPRLMEVKCPRCGEIVEVFQKGYKKGKHIIRFAMVKTAN